MGALHEALCKAIADCGEGVGKDKQAQGYKFRGIDQVLNFLNPIMAKHQLALVPHNVTDELVVERQSKSGGTLYFARAKVDFRLYHASGEALQVMVWSEAMDSSDKALNKVMSIAWKYAAIQTFCIPVEDVADENPHSNDMAPSRPEQPPQQPRRPASDAWKHAIALGPQYNGAKLADLNGPVLGKYISAMTEHIKRHPEAAADRRRMWTVSLEHAQQAFKALQQREPTPDEAHSQSPEAPDDDDIPF